MSGALEARIAALEQRLEAMMTPGRVTHVDPAAGKCRIRMGGDDAPFLSPWVRYAQIAGALKVHAPPTVGQQMTLHSPSGDPGQGLAVPYGWTDDNPSPGDGSNPVATFGPVRVELTDVGLTLTVGASVLLVTADQIKLTGSEIVTDGLTKLNNGTREVVYKGSLDTRGDANNQGASGVFV